MKHQLGWPGILSATSALLAVCFTSGCAVLTQQQVDAVRQFANATKNYAPLPGEVVRAYADVHVNAGFILFVPTQRTTTNVDDINQTWAGMVNKEGTSRVLGEDADRIDAQFAVVDKFASLLCVLSSNEFSVALDTSASAFGKSVSNAISAYNGIDKSANVPSVGSTVAEIVSGIGRIFLRYRQEKALKHYVIEGYSPMTNITSRAKEIMQGFLAGEVHDLGAETNQLRIDFVQTATVYNNRIPLDLTEAFHTEISKALATMDLAKKAADAADKYQVAYSNLVNAVQTKSNLTEAVQEIQSLASDIEAAQQVKSNMEKGKP